MNRLPASAVLVLCAFTAACGGGDNDRSPTNTPSPAVPTNTPAASAAVASATTATAPPAETPPAATTATPGTDAWMTVGGHVWVDARPAGGEVTVLIDGRVCAVEQTLLPPVGTPVFSIEVPSASLKPGCGTAGATVQFAFNGTSVPQTVTFSSGETKLLELIAGPPFGRYGGTFTYADAIADYVVEPLIDGHVCGEQLPWPKGGPEHTFFYELVVDPDALREGCGRDGAAVDVRVRITLPGGADYVGHIAAVPWQTSGLQVLPERAIPLATATPDSKRLR